MGKPKNTVKCRVIVGSAVIVLVAVAVVVVVCLFVCLFLCFFVSLFLCLFLCFFVSLFLCLVVCLFVVCLLFVCLFVSLFLCFFVSLFLCLVVCFFVSLFLCFFVCFFVSLFLCLVAANTQCLEFMCCAAPFQTGDVHIQLLFQVLLFTFCCMLLLFSFIFGRSLFCDCRCCRQKFVRTNQFTTPSLNSSLSFAGLVSLMFFVIGVY